MNINLNAVSSYELMPNDGRKSFYKKAYVYRDTNGASTLLSYGTPIIRRDADGTMHRLWSGYSATTGRHIAAFCGMNKAQFTALKVGE